MYENYNINQLILPLDLDKNDIAFAIHYLVESIPEEASKTKCIYKQRKIDVEPAFSYLKASLRFSRLSVRGKKGPK